MIIIKKYSNILGAFIGFIISYLMWQYSPYEYVYKSWFIFLLVLLIILIWLLIEINLNHKIESIETKQQLSEIKQQLSETKQQLSESKNNLIFSHKVIRIFPDQNKLLFTCNICNIFNVGSLIAIYEQKNDILNPIGIGHIESINSKGLIQVSYQLSINLPLTIESISISPTLTKEFH